MNDQIHPLATHHLPPFITAPGQTDSLLLAFIDLPDLATPLGRISDTLERLIGPGSGGDPAPATGPADPDPQDTPHAPAQQTATPHQTAPQPAAVTGDATTGTGQTHA